MPIWPKRGTQEDEILFALKCGYEITPMDALIRFGCFRLGARIHNLRNMGWPIERTMKASNGKHFAAYTFARK